MNYNIPNSFRCIAAVFRHEMALLRQDWLVPVIALIALPIVVMFFAAPALGFQISAAEGIADATGFEQAVPGFGVMFANIGVAFLCQIYFQEHGWNTWDRLRTSGARPLEIILGKVMIGSVMICSQMTVLFIFGHLVFDLRFFGSLFLLATLVVVFAINLSALALLLSTVCQSIQQANALANLLGLLMAGFGGALSPVSTLPAWVSYVAPFVPSYWAMSGFRDIFLKTDGGTAGTTALIALVGMTLLFLAVSILLFRPDAEKRFWS